MAVLRRVRVYVYIYIYTRLGGLLRCALSLGPEGTALPSSGIRLALEGLTRRSTTSHVRLSPLTRRFATREHLPEKLQD